ncbi:MAG: hypothetical protein HYZ42_11870, partial [Bacteroidetes bacterium]|nr:hypothetical protein [Bacteroidota bacterium]
GLSIATGATYSHTFSTTFNVSSSGTYHLKAWVRNPNGNDPDNDNTNDTLGIDKCTGLYGQYTIDNTQGASTSNFQTFNDAISALTNCGVSGSVIFKVASGTYNERISIPTVNGVDANNTITFDGVNRNLRTISSSDLFTIELDGADYIHFRNFKIENTSSSQAINIHLTNGADHNIFDSCYIWSSATNFSNFSFAIMGSNPYASGQFGNENILSNSEVENGSYAVVIIGGLNTKSSKNILLNNYIHTNGNYGLFCYHTDSTVIESNYIDNSSFGTNIYLNNANNTVLKKSKLNSKIYNLNINNSGNLTIVNNFLYGTCYYNIYAYNLSNANILFNSIYNSNKLNYAYSAVYLFGSSANTYNIDFRNNIVALSGSNQQMYCITGSPSYFKYLDYNNFYNANSNNFVNLGISYSSVNAVQGQNGLNNMVYNVQPNFVSTTSVDLHLNNSFKSPSGVSIIGMNVDFDGENRCSIAPSIGADESKYILSKPKSNFSQVDTGYVNSPITFFNTTSSSDVQVYKWYVDSGVNPIDSSTNFIHTFDSVGLHHVTLSSANCSNSSDTTKEVYITVPNSSPTVDFISNKNLMEVGEEVFFTNLSSGGDTAWFWEIYPSSQVSFSKGSSASAYHASMSFISKGIYEICLTSYNRFGSNKLCKSKYIEVVTSENMCKNAVVNDLKGYFYDDGGKTANYNGVNQCSMLIDPCASSITMEFKRFEVNNGTGFLKIWDGKDASSGKPLHTGSGWTGISSPGKLTAYSGKMYIEWKSTYNNQMPGWEAQWTSSRNNYSKQIIIPIVPSIAYLGANVNFDIKNYDPYSNYQWLIGGNPVGSVKATSYMFNTIGTYDVCLVVSSCWGNDTICKKIDVINPTARY